MTVVPVISTTIIEGRQANPLIFHGCGRETEYPIDFLLSKIERRVPLRYLKLIEEQNLKIDEALGLVERSPCRNPIPSGVGKAGQNSVNFLNREESPPFHGGVLQGHAELEDEAGREDFIAITLKSQNEGAETTPFMERTSPNFWKNRLIFHLLASPSIHAAKFIPTSMHTVSLLFIEKQGAGNEVIDPSTIQEEERKPLTPMEGVRLSAVSALSERSTIRSEQDIPPTIQGLDGTAFRDVKTCLGFFLRDTTTKILYLTFKASEDYCITHGWEKA